MRKGDHGPEVLVDTCLANFMPGLAADLTTRVSEAVLPVSPVPDTEAVTAELVLL